MATHPSPGVYTKIIDLSTYLQEIPGTTGFVPFLSKRGPDNVLQMVTSLQQFSDLYTVPNIDEYGKDYGLGKYIAWNHISASPSFYAMRATSDDAAYSNAFILFYKDSTGEDPIPANVEALFDRWSDSTGAIIVGHKENVNTKAEIDTILESTAEDVFAICAIYPIGRGDSYNDFGFSLAQSSNTNLWISTAKPWQKVYTFNIYETQSDGDDVIIESFTVSFDDTATDSSGESMYIKDVVNKFSKNIRIEINTDTLNEWKKSSSADIDVGTDTDIHLYYGSEGALITVDIDTGRRVIDTSEATNLLTSAYSCLLVNPMTSLVDETLRDLDDVYIPLVYDAGYPQEVKDAAQDLVSTIRMDGVLIQDNSDQVSYDATILNRNNINVINSKYCSIFEEFSKVYDVHTGKDIWVSPVYHMASMIPNNDNLYEVWYANAGFNRGTINGIKELRYSPNQDQRDQLYLKQINPIVKFSGNYVVWGNLTSQNMPSSLQDLNVMRMVLYVQRALEQFCKYFVFEMNDMFSWNQVTNSISPFLESVKSRRGLVSYSVDVGATEYEFTHKIMHVNVILQPMKVVERIELNLLIK